MKAGLSLLKSVSAAMLLGVIGLLILPDGRNDPGDAQLIRHMAAAIYRFPSDAMPRCEQFMQQTTFGPLAGQVLCQSRTSRFFM